MEQIHLVRAENGVCFFCAESLSCCPHGFSTRLGGVSSDPSTDSLNLGFGFVDDEATVLENLRLYGAAVGFDIATLVSIRQVHSAAVRVVTVADAGLGYTRPTDTCCDGYVTCERGVTLGIRTADCVPILAAAIDEQGEPYVVGAFHAGWRGTASGIAAEGVRQMISLGAHVEDIRAMGPCIRACCFEIDDTARAVLVERLGVKLVERFVLPSPHKSGHYDADLIGINRTILAEDGVLPEHIVAADACTACQPLLFYSHRRNGMTRGSMLSVICLPT